MNKRRIWRERMPITGGDLTEVGLYHEDALGLLAHATGPGILSGLQAQASATPDSQFIVRAGWGLIHDPAVGRPRLVRLAADATLPMTSLPAGAYAVVASAVEKGAENRTIMPPPVGHPFYEPDAQPYQIDTVKQWEITLTTQPEPFNPSGASAILARVSWDGVSIKASDVTMVMVRPKPQLADGSVPPLALQSLTKALGGLLREADGQLSVMTDDVTLGIHQSGDKVGRLHLRDGSVTDVKIGTVNPDDALPLPTTDAAAQGGLRAVMSWFAGALRAITGKANWYDAPATTLEALHQTVARKGQNETVTGAWTFDQVLQATKAPTAGAHLTNKTYVDAGDAAQAARLGAIEAADWVVTTRLKDDAVTDAKLGARTVNQTVTTSSNSGTLTALLSALAGRVQAITGKTNWYDAPSTTLEALHGSVARKASAETITGAWAFGALPTAAPAPTAPTHLTNKGYVDSGLGAVADRVQALEGAQITATKLQDGSVTDVKIGARTPDQGAATPATPTTPLTLQALVNAVASRVKAVLGTASWTDAVPVTLQQAATRLTALEAAKGAAGLTAGAVTAGHLAEDARVYDLASFYPGRPAPQSALFAYVAARPVTVRAAAPGQAVAQALPSAGVSAPVTRVNAAGAAVTVGNVVFAAGTRVASIQLTGDVTLAAGEQLVVRMAAQADATLADIAITVRGTY